MNKKTNTKTVHIIDDDDAVRNSIAMSLSVEGYKTKAFSSASEFLENYKSQPGCVVTDVEMPSISGIDLQKILIESNIHIPIIFITGQGNIPMSVKAMKQGAIDFLEKPFMKDDLIRCIRCAFEADTQSRQQNSLKQKIQQNYRELTAREKQIFHMLVKDRAKLTNKEIAEELSISKRTVEVHRSNIMSKMKAETRAELIEYARFCDKN